MKSSNRSHRVLKKYTQLCLRCCNVGCVQAKSETQTKERNMILFKKLYIRVRKFNNAKIGKAPTQKSW